MAMQTPIHGSEAYDLSLFEERPAPKLREIKPSAKAIKEQRRRNRMQTVINTAVTILTVTAICAVVGLLIFNRVQITEVNDQIISQQKELEVLDSEMVRLSNELASRMSAQQVDAYATQNGMQKIDSYQLKYITVDAGDRLDVAEDGKMDFFESVSAGISDFFRYVAYLFE